MRRNWLELPPDVMSIIFLKLEAVDILLSVQLVCSPWRKYTKEPHLWRSVDMRKCWDPSRYDVLEKIAREAVDRSCGHLVEFSVQRFATDKLLLHTADKCSGTLRCLRLVSCNGVSGDGLIEMAKKLRVLEVLEVCDGIRLPTEVLGVVGSLCRQLKSFRLNDLGYRKTSLWSDNHALAIANSMPQLLHLHLFGSVLTDNGLRAILDGCPHLESLDLRRCYRLRLEEDLLKRFADTGIKRLRLPEDPIDDYEYNFYNSYDEFSFEEDDFGYMYHDIDFDSVDSEAEHYSVDSEVEPYSDLDSEVERYSDLDSEVEPNSDLDPEVEPYSDLDPEVEPYSETELVSDEGSYEFSNDDNFQSDNEDSSDYGCT